jgi:hypothetical protein
MDHSRFEVFVGVVTPLSHGVCSAPVQHRHIVWPYSKPGLDSNERLHYSHKSENNVDMGHCNVDVS